VLLVNVILLQRGSRVQRGEEPTMAVMKLFSSEDASMQIAVVTAYITLCTSVTAGQ
jgi:hypothetical protein